MSPIHLSWREIDYSTHHTWINPVDCSLYYFVQYYKEYVLGLGNNIITSRYLVWGIAALSPPRCHGQSAATETNDQETITVEVALYFHFFFFCNIVIWNASTASRWPVLLLTSVRATLLRCLDRPQFQLVGHEVSRYLLIAILREQHFCFIVIFIMIVN